MEHAQTEFRRGGPSFSEVARTTGPWQCQARQEIFIQLRLRVMLHYVVTRCLMKSNLLFRYVHCMGMPMWIRTGSHHPAWCPVRAFGRSNWVAHHMYFLILRVSFACQVLHTECQLHACQGFPRLEELSATSNLVVKLKPATDVGSNCLAFTQNMILHFSSESYQDELFRVKSLSLSIYSLNAVDVKPNSTCRRCCGQ